MFLQHPLHKVRQGCHIETAICLDELTVLIVIQAFPDPSAMRLRSNDRRLWHIVTLIWMCIKTFKALLAL